MIYAGVVGFAFLAFVAVAVTHQLAWAFVQPESTDTLAPSMHALRGLAAASAVMGSLLGLTRLRTTDAAPAFGVLLSAAVGVALVAAVVAFGVTGMVGAAQPCAGDACDIAAAPAAVIVAAAVAGVGSVCAAGACMAVAAVRIWVPVTSGWRLGEGG